MHVRVAKDGDLAEMVGIYNAHVLSGYATFDEQPFQVDERREWFDMFSPVGRYRCLVAVDEDAAVRGYASSRRYRDHSAFDRTVELSIYLDDDAAGGGVGTQLYEALFDSLVGEPIHRFVAGIALPNPASVSLHERFGFAEVGVFEEYAVKNGEWISSLWMQRPASWSRRGSGQSDSFRAISPSP